MLDPSRKLFRWGPISACPLFMYPTIETSFSPMKKIFDVCYPESLIFFKDNKVTWLLDNQGFIDRSKEFVEKNILNKTKRNRYYQLWKRSSEELLRLFDEIENQKLFLLDKEDLKKLFKKFAKVYHRWWTITMTVELVTVSAEPLLSEKLKPYFPDEHPKDFNKAFAILTSPLVLTFYRKEQRDLINILLLSKDKQNQALKNHQKNYHWIYNSYSKASALDVEYFNDELEKLKKVDYKKIFEEIESYDKNIRKDKEIIVKKINPKKEILELVSIVERFSQLQDERKMNNFKADYFLEIFVREFAKRTGVSPEDLKLLTTNEFEESLNFIEEGIIKKRKESFVIIADDETIEEVFEKKAVTIAQMYSEIPRINESIVHGVLASTGDTYYFRGTAKVVLTIDQIDKLEEGDILITTMTSPDFVIGMKKAGAIITDTGGILCHAAIVSRELKKPCIVGTGIATKVIRDGDVVELHCGRGTVRIIKH